MAAHIIDPQIEGNAFIGAFSYVWYLRHSGEILRNGVNPRAHRSLRKYGSYLRGSERLLVLSKNTHRSDF
ncbi:MAG: hypothetical protein ABI045_05550 [Flavobacteriales bacterium]